MIKEHKILFSKMKGNTRPKRLWSGESESVKTDRANFGDREKGHYAVGLASGTQSVSTHPRDSLSLPGHSPALTLLPSMAHDTTDQKAPPWPKAHKAMGPLSGALLTPTTAPSPDCFLWLLSGLLTPVCVCSSGPQVTGLMPGIVPGPDPCLPASNTGCVFCHQRSLRQCPTRPLELAGLAQACRSGVLRHDLPSLVVGESVPTASHTSWLPGPGAAKVKAKTLRKPLILTKGAAPACTPLPKNT